MAVRKNLLELCEKIADGHYRIDENCAEYKCFEKWLTDDQIKVMFHLGRQERYKSDHRLW